LGYEYGAAPVVSADVADDAGRTACPCSHRFVHFTVPWHNAVVAPTLGTVYKYSALEQYDCWRVLRSAASGMCRTSKQPMHVEIEPWATQGPKQQPSSSKESEHEREMKTTSEIQ